MYTKQRKITEENIKHHNFEYHKFSLENQVGFHFADNNSTIHTHDGFAEFSLIVSGEWDHTINGTTERLKKNTLIFLGNNTLHLLDPRSLGCNHFTFFFKEEFLKKTLLKFFPNNMSILSTQYKSTILPPSTASFLLFEAHKMIGSRSTQNHDIEFQNYMHNLIYLMFFSDNSHSVSTDQTKYAHTLKMYFDNYILLEDTIKNAYKMFPISPATLIKQFEKETGKTITQYRNDKRMEYAAILLQDWNSTVIDVANRVGICSPSHFAAEFKKKFGISPKEYSNNFRRK